MRMFGSERRGNAALQRLDLYDYSSKLKVDARLVKWIDEKRK